MPTIVAAIDPVTRIEGHLKVDIAIDTVGEPEAPLEPARRDAPVVRTRTDGCFGYAREGSSM